MLDVKEETFTEKEMANIIKSALDAAKIHKQNSGTILVGSLCPHLLADLQFYLPDQNFIPIVRSLEDLEAFSKIKAKTFALKYSLASRKLIHRLHEEGHQVWVWTVDDKPLAKRLISRGVDGIITNHPKKMMLLHK
jgi:glycerophosphoryl diester phosphodiesterase